MSFTKTIQQKGMFDYTPMNNDAKTLPIYRRNRDQSGVPNEIVLLTTNINRPDLNIGRVIWGEAKAPSISGLTGGYLTECMVFEGEGLDSKFNKSFDLFLRKIQNKDIKLNDTLLSEVEDIYRRIFHFLISYNPEYLTADLTADNTLFFQSKIKESEIYLEYYLDQNISDEPEMVINLYKDPDMYIAFMGSINDCMEVISQKLPELYFNKPYLNFECGNELSQTSLTPESF